VPAVLERERPEHLLGQADDELLGQVHQVLVRGAGLIELEQRELRVVLRRQALVAEDAAELEDALEAADDQALQVELGRDAEVEVDVERVVMCDKRSRRGAAGHALHHRRLDLEEAALAEEAPDVIDDAAPDLEDAPRLGVGDEVEVALAVARLDVLEAVPLLRQGAERLGQEPELVHLERQLAVRVRKGRPRTPIRSPRSSRR
jgi:hypothetical protein